MKVVSIKSEDGGRLKAVKFKRIDAIYWLLPQDARIAENWANSPEVARGDVTLSAFIQKNAVRIDQYREPLPLELEPEPDAETMISKWNCANRHLGSQAALLTIIANRISCCNAMGVIESLVDEAGPGLARAIVDQLDPHAVPF